MSFPRFLLRVSCHRRLSSSTSNALRLLSTTTTTTTKASTPSPSNSISTLRAVKSVIRSLRREHNLDTFLSRFHLYSASSPRFRSDASIYEVAVLRLAAAGRFDDVTAIVEALRPQDPDDCNSSCPSRLISLYGKAGMHERARETFRQLPRSTRSFNALLSALGSNGGVVDAFETISTDYPELVPDVYSYTIVINALCEKGDFDKAVEILGLMETKGVAPNVDTFITLLDAFYKNDRYDEAEKVWGIMREKNCQDARSFNPKLRWLVNNGRTPEAVKVIGEMESGGLKPDGYGMASLIAGHCKDGNLKEAKKLYGQIRRQNCPRYRLMYEALVPKVRNAGETNLALSLCHESVKNKCYVSAEVLQVVVDDLVKASKVDDATNLVNAAWSSRHYSKHSIKMPMLEPCMKWQLEQQKGKDESLEQISDSWEETMGSETKRGEPVLDEQQKGKDESLKQRSDSREETEGVETKRCELVIDESFSEEQNEKEKQAKKAYAKIGIIVKSFEKPKYLGAFGIPLDKNRVKLPSTRTLITVLRSPHIDKKSREQFEMKVRREYIVIKCEPHELHKKYFWFKRTRILGAQFEFVFSYKTRLDMSRLLSSPS